MDRSVKIHQIPNFVLVITVSFLGLMVRSNQNKINEQHDKFDSIVLDSLEQLRLRFNNIQLQLPDSNLPGAVPKPQ